MARWRRIRAFFIYSLLALIAPSILVCGQLASAKTLTQITEEPTGLIIPVAGVRASDLRDTFSQARAEGRTHNALDIMAPHGTPVLAAADGEVVKLFYSERGGNTIYQLSEDKRFVFYYAHLASYAADLKQGHKARQGEVLAYVGDTGNAGAGNYHLHFAIWLVTDPKHYWDGINLNPYPILRKAAEAARTGVFPGTLDLKKMKPRSNEENEESIKRREVERLTLALPPSSSS